MKHEEEFEPGAYLKKEKETDLTGIADIKPEEFNPERFDLKKDFFTMSTPPKTNRVEMGSIAMQAPDTLSMDAVANDSGILETDELELEDELPEEFALSNIDSPEIPQPVEQEEKTEEEFVVPSEPKIPVSKKEEEKPEEEFIVPPEPKIPVSKKEEEKPEEKFAVPSKLFSLEYKKKQEENTAPPAPEVKTMPTVKEEMPVEKHDAPPELKLFTLAEKPVTLKEGMPNESSVQEEKVKKATKRKSLF